MLIFLDLTALLANWSLPPLWNSAVSWFRTPHSPGSSPLLLVPLHLPDLWTVACLGLSLQTSSVYTQVTWSHPVSGLKIKQLVVTHRSGTCFFPGLQTCMFNCLLDRASWMSVYLEKSTPLEPNACSFVQHGSFEVFPFLVSGNSILPIVSRYKNFRVICNSCLSLAYHI